MDGKIESLMAARDVLRSGLEKSRSIGLELERSGKRLEEMTRRLPSLESALGLFPLRMCSSNLAMEDRVKCGIRPANAVLQVCETVHELEALLSVTPASDLTAYLSLVKNLEQALKFLGNNCGLAIQWLQGVAEFLEENGVATDRLVSNVKRSLIILRDLEAAEERSRLDGGAMDAAFGKIEAEFERLLEENSVPFGPESDRPDEESDKNFPDPVIPQLQAIIERLSSNHRLEKCVSTYIAIRSMNARASLQPLDLDYLDEPFEDNQTVESRIRKWSEDLKFAVKGLLGHEHRLCSRIFEQQLTDEIPMSCFVEIAARSEISRFLQFGKRVTESRKSPDKLLNLLDMFSVLDDLRPDFTWLFGGVSCEEIQTQTRDLIKRVVEGSWDIFWELSYQVELQRLSPPPSDGAVPELVSFVTKYCNRLLGNVYRPALIKTMEIHQSWKREKYQEGLFTNQIYSLVKEIGLNLDTWAKAYEDRSLSWLFMMNNHGHFGDLRGSKLGDMMGDSWLRAHEQYRDQYAALYVEEIWGKLSAPLEEEYPSQRRLRCFNEVLEEAYEKQGEWSVANERLREKVRASAMEAVLPAYRDYLRRYRAISGDEFIVGGREEIKYSVQEVEEMIGSLFEPKPRKVGTGKRYYAIDDKLDNAMANNQFCLTLTAA